MSRLSVEFSFDDEKLKQKGKSKADLYYALKKNFARQGLVCTADTADMITFSGTGRKEDEGRTWFLLISLINTDWFEDCATRCMFYRRGIKTDILADIPHAKQTKAKAMRGLRGNYA